MEAYLQPWNAFTASHRPIYSPHEIELAIIDRATLTVGDEKHGRDCSVSLTTHRLIFQHTNNSTASYLHLALVKRAELHSSFLSTPKLTLHLNPRPLAPPPPPTAPTDLLTYHTHLTTTTSIAINPPPPGYFRLTATPSDALHLLATHLTTALTTHTYTHPPAPQPPTAGPASAKQFSTSSAGVGGLMRDVDASARRTDATLDAAFTDLSTLMAHAKDIVTLAQRFARTLAASATHSTEEEAALASLLTTMGLPNPITKHSTTSHSSFHTHLARQLSDFLSHHPTFTANGHMLTLPDVYCLYNRARGTDLISPDDCRRACELLGEVGGTGLGLQRLEGGVLVVCRSGEVESGVEAVVGVVRAGGGGGGGGGGVCGMALVELSGVLGVSVVLVEERCLLAEKRGWLVRDESVEGVRWWTNQFDEWVTDGTHSAATAVT